MPANTPKVLIVTALLTMAPCSPAGDAPLDGTPLQALAGYIGDWEINTTWADGSELWSYNEFRPGLGGSFLEITTSAKDENGKVYERYFTIFAYDSASDRLQSYGFTFDGTVTVVEDIELEGDASNAALTSQWGSPESQIRQTIRLVSSDTYNWKVWSGDGQNWELIMDADWQRVE